MKKSPSRSALFIALLAALAFLGLAREASAARGRPYINAAKTTFVSDTGTLLRGPRLATDSGTLTRTEADLVAIKSYGCNAVHLYAEGSGHGYAAGAQAALVDQVVQWTRDNGLYLVITIGTGSGLDASFTSAFWTFYAPRYASETHVIYEILNESSSGAPVSGSVMTIEKNAYTIIRANAPNTPVLFFSYMTFNSGAGVLQDIASLGTTVNWSNAAIAFHGYGEAGRAGCRACLVYVLNAGYPCFQTEFYRWPWGTGNFALASSDSLYQDVTETGDFERLGVSWLNFLDVRTVLDDTRFKTPLLNAGILWAPDFGTWPAGSRSTYANSGEPWPTTGLAGTLHIEAENFDNGGQGIAYNDNTTTNSGGKYRTNYGVDIESTTDTGGGYDVGWIVSGEWLEYTTNINDAGLYNLSLRVASPSAASVRVKFGGVDVTGAWAVPATGANQTWTTITKTVMLSPGQQILHVDALASGFNLNWIELTPVSTGQVANGTYKILNRNSAKAMDVVNASTADGAGIQQWSYSATANQKWVLTHKGGGQYTITSSRTGKGIDEESYTALSGNYIDVYSLWNGTGSANQRWIVTPTDSGYYQIISANSGLVLEITGASTANGALVDQWGYSGGVHQQWQFGTP